MKLPMPVEVGTLVEELAKNGVGLPIQGYDDEELTEISVQIARVVHDRVSHSPVHDDDVR